MKKIVLPIFILIILGSLFFLFGLKVVPENFQSQEVLEVAKNNDVIIVFNSGGWGNTPLEEAEDFSPIIKGIQETLNEWGYNSIVIPYSRTKNTLIGEITGVKDFLSSFKFSSEILAQDLEVLTENLPDKKIILAGLSSGGAFVDETMEKISDKAKSSVYAITAGVPFWQETFESKNILHLNNNGRDSLAEGDTKFLVLALIKAPFVWIFSKINGENLTFSQAVKAPGHEYFWDSPGVGSEIATFLESKLR